MIKDVALEGAELVKEEILFEDLQYLINHGIVVSKISSLVSRELGMDKDFIYQMALAGLLHDIGKLKIGNYLYGRNAKDLKVEEIKYVRMHSTLGYEILKNEGYSAIILEAVLHHHENFDGTGYPANLKGEEIPFGARILRVCDVFSALVENRPYRRAFKTEIAMKLLIEEVKNFDMKCFLALQRAIHRKEFQEIEGLILENNRVELIPSNKESRMNLDFW